MGDFNCNASADFRSNLIWDGAGSAVAGGCLAGTFGPMPEETVGRLLETLGTLNAIPVDCKDEIKTESITDKEETIMENLTVKIDYKNKSFIDYEAKLGEEIEYMVEDTKLTVEREILDTKRALKAAEAVLADLKTEYPLNIERIVDKTEEIENHKKYLKVVEGLKKELF